MTSHDKRLLKDYLPIAAISVLEPLREADLLK
jgi:hypothetical protein